MNIIEELKQIEGMEPIAELIETVINLDENALNDDSIELIKESIMQSIEGNNRDMTIKSVHNSYRRSGATVGQVIAESKAIVEAFDKIDENVETENKYKKDLISFVFEKMKEIVTDSANSYFTEDAQVFVEFTNMDAQIPTYADFASSGADVYAIEDMTIAKSTRGKIVKTGLKMAIPLGWELQVRPRSGLSVKTAMRIANTPGTIDAGYPDEIGIIVDNLSSKDIEIKKGDRIAQFVLAPVYKAKFTVVDSVAPHNAWSPRSGGFGSTGA